MYLARCSLNLLREDLEIYLNRFPSICSFNWNHDRFSQNVTRIENEASLAKEKNCAYCDKTGNLTKEHVYPDCFLRELGSISIAQTPKGDKAISSAQQIHDVCSDCNNVLLSPLDRYFCDINRRHFSSIVHPGESVQFKYDFDLLARALLKIGFNVARSRHWPLNQFRRLRPFILGQSRCPSRLLLFLQLLVPTPINRTTLPATPGTKSIEPLPIHA
jgi:hypothetical protein